MDSSLWRVPVPQPRTLVADEYDSAIYRTELTGDSDGSWELRVDAVLVAETDGPLDQDAAQGRRRCATGPRSGPWTASLPGGAGRGTTGAGATQRAPQPGHPTNRTTTPATGPGHRS